MDRNRTIIFVCEHGVAKSILAAAYFNKLAPEKNLLQTGIARGTHPDPELSLQAVSGLRKDGLTPAESIPIKFAREDVESADRIISFCELPEGSPTGTIVEHWNDIPSVSENYQAARDAIVKHIEILLTQL